MRRGLALVLALTVVVQPTFAESKSKPKTKGASTHEVVAALEVCEAFVRNDPSALEKSIAAGWDVEREEGDGPFIVQFYGGRELAGIGQAHLMVLQESYPSGNFGYCRIDVPGPSGSGEAIVNAFARLYRYSGEVFSEGEASFGSFSGVEEENLLLTAWTPDAYFIQLSQLTPKSEETN